MIMYRVLRGWLQAAEGAGGADQRQLQQAVCRHPVQQVHGLLHHPGLRPQQPHSRHVLAQGKFQKFMLGKGVDFSLKSTKENVT